MPALDANGIRLFHRTAGTGADVVLVHGLGASHAFWYPAVAPALARDHRVTVYDLRGHGRSAMPAAGYAASTMAGDLAALLDALRIPFAHLVGHSWGGLVALELALRRPERVASVVVADSRLPARRRGPRAGTWDGFDGWRAELARDGVRVDAHDALDHRILERLARPRARDDGARAARKPFAPFGGFGSGRRSRERWLELLAATSAARELERPGFAVPARLRGVRAPVLAVYGERSFALPSGRLLARTVPGCRLVVVPRAGHFHPAAAPEGFVAAVRAFLTEVTGCPRPTRA